MREVIYTGTAVFNEYGEVSWEFFSDDTLSIYIKNVWECIYKLNDLELVFREGSEHPYTWWTSCQPPTTKHTIAKIINDCSANKTIEELIAGDRYEDNR